jgi:2-polyprenyl-6-methoxyphenol hydroxylase-like FAD-dependent oxidoreductase
MPLTKIIIVGAGPSGLLLALLLARANIPVTLLEQSPSLDTNHRASHYTADSCAEFDRAGILDEVRAQGFLPDSVSWRRLDGDKTRLVTIRNEDNGEERGYGMVCLPLQRLGRILEGRVVGEGVGRLGSIGRTGRRGVGL